MMLTDEWYPTLTKPNVELVTDRIAAVTPAGIRDATGVERPADVLVLATGFASHGFVAPMEIAGRDGRALAEEWAEVPRAYLGLSVPGFPNMFLLYGPNTNGGTGSVIYTIEAGIGHVHRRPAPSSIVPRRAGSRCAARRPSASTASCATPSPARSGTAAAPTGTSTRTATTRSSGPGCGAPTGGGRRSSEPGAYASAPHERRPRRTPARGSRRRPSRAFLPGSFPGDLGIEPLEIEDTHSRGRIVVDKRHLHPGGFVHGGVWTALGDTVAAWATFRSIPPGHNFTTIELKLNVFAAGLLGDEIVAVAEPLHTGKSTVVIEVRMERRREGTEPRLAANLIVSQFVLPPA